MLADAKAGRIIAGAFLLINNEGKVGELLIDEGEPGYAFHLVAGLELLKHDAMHCIGNDFVDEDV